jgi:hypothetical protein
MLKAAVLGLGVMGRHHCRVLNGLDGVEFIGVYDPGGNVPATIEGKQVYKNFSELLDLKPDYCVVASPTIFHLELGLELGVDVLHDLALEEQRKCHLSQSGIKKLHPNAGASAAELLLKSRGLHAGAS